MGNLILELADSKKVIEAKIAKALSKEVDRMLTRATNKMIVPTRRMIYDALIKQPEVQALSGGRLAGDFGLPDGRGRIENIIRAWSNGIIVTKRNTSIVNQSINAGITLKAIRSDFSDVLSLPASRVTTENGQELPWLEWLLLFGDRTILTGYFVKFKRSRRSRSGIAITVEREGSRWSVPSQFAGTESNNMTTRAMASIEAPLTEMMQRTIQASIR